MPRLDGASRSVGGNGYHGLVDEDKLIVDVTPKIRAVGAEICAFRIVNKHHGETPFEVQFLLKLIYVHSTVYILSFLSFVLVCVLRRRNQSQLSSSTAAYVVHDSCFMYEWVPGH